MGAGTPRWGRAAIAICASVCVQGCPDLGTERMDWSQLDRPTGSGGILSADDAPEVADVLIEGMTFVPARVIVRTGGTVYWHNADNVPHSVNSGQPRAPAGIFDSPLLQSNDSWSFTFEQSGEYEYFCAPHSGIMNGYWVEVFDVEDVVPSAP